MAESEQSGAGPDNESGAWSNLLPPRESLETGDGCNGRAHGKIRVLIWMEIIWG
jgi:hypothetical protein